MAVSAVAPYGVKLVLLAQKLDVGGVTEGLLLLAKAWCVCMGISVLSKVWTSSPALWPKVNPWPTCIGTRLRKSGSKKLVVPLPPYVVPNKENRAWFWLMGNVCPLHIAQPLGAKLKEKILISDKKGSAII
jgi:hypothetical protein